MPSLDSQQYIALNIETVRGYAQDDQSFPVAKIVHFDPMPDLFGERNTTSMNRTGLPNCFSLINKLKDEADIKLKRNAGLGASVKNFVGGLEAQAFAGSVVDKILDPADLLRSDV
ncbi:MAG: hypothetical protein SFX18_09505, partial [Pirellulales bacterium]|nr:hypothetical protein [Pirellulales bacterium]